ncbi:DUF4332 domain-containing protein [Aquimarina gracilis]|uniref:DUF4332 domain-containing protein n=1 Tax=Aquimarina gracilis TaxID=874422 RepID=A0ABU5ZSQ2_9FLAO|nr:DUF4332 domain-containing protein [Aquimarina gracilis]MEB3344989.1 DUF4332 domain-containing protein [Aquimarina gracilis]
MGYYIDLEKVSIDDYKDILKSTHLIPSWKILKENIDSNLETIKKQGITNLQILQNLLKDKSKLKEFSKLSGLPGDYLNVLRRMINGYHPRPNRIKDFPETSLDVISKLEEMGIKNTRHVFDNVKTQADRMLLSKETGIHHDEILRLTKLTDLCRIRWVNHTFAYVLYEAGYDTVKKMAKANPEQLFATVKQLNAERNFYHAHIGLNDMKMLVESAKMLPREIVY